MTANAKEIEAVLKLPAPQRYSHFIRKVVGWRKMWGLYDDGWAMSEDDDGAPLLPLWPEREYAERCIAGEWASYQPKEIELDEALADMIPALRDAGVQPALFFTPEHGSLNATLDDLERDLREELKRYE